jgi:hypothetical protein
MQGYALAVNIRRWYVDVLHEFSCTKLADDIKHCKRI